MSRGIVSIVAREQSPICAGATAENAGAVIGYWGCRVLGEDLSSNAANQELACRRGKVSVGNHRRRGSHRTRHRPNRREILHR